MHHRPLVFFFFFQAEDGIRDLYVTGVQTCALPISLCSGAADGLSLLGQGQARLPERPHARGRSLPSHPVARNRVLFECGAVCRTDQALGRRDTGGRAAGNALGANIFGYSSVTIIISENVARPDWYFLTPMYHVSDTLGLHSVTICYSKPVVKIKRPSTIRQQALLVNPLGVLDLFR